MKTSTTHSYCDDYDGCIGNEILNIDANKNESYLIDGSDSCCRKRLPPLSDVNESDNDNDDDDDNDNDTTDNEGDFEIGEGIKENDSFLVEKIVASPV